MCMCASAATKGKFFRGNIIARFFRVHALVIEFSRTESK